MIPHKRLLVEALAEIRSLRRSNEVLTAQIGVVEVFAAALGLKRRDGGMAPDIAWELQKMIDAMPEIQEP